jgi:nucleoside-diphosphate-sugar epimerase
MNQKKILVTGGLGFIGRVLLKSLFKDIDQIKYIDVVDNLSNSSTLTSPDLDAFKNKLNIFVNSVHNWTPCRDYTEIYHLASPVGPAGVLNYAGRMGPMIVSDTYKMANLALDQGARLIDISTSEVYGREPGNIGQKEDIDKIVPGNITVRLEYGVSKLACEVSLLNMIKATPLKVNIIRPFNIVGPSQSGEVGFVLPRFIDQALKGKPLTVFGNGSQKRTFTSVNDFIRGIRMVMDSDVNGEIFNIGNPANLCSVLDLAKIVIRLTNSSSEISLTDPKTIYGPLYAEAWNKIPDITKVQQKIGWHPKESIEDIVLEAIKVAQE